MNVRDEIVAKRKARIKAEGFFQGLEKPQSREVPLVPFCPGKGVICEMKRASPSKGDIFPGLDPVAQAAAYVSAGASFFSVLTEQDYFKGSLRDLRDAKRSQPNKAFLRKDFLLYEEDIEAAYLFGADAVLLIAGMLEQNQLERLYRKAKDLGLEALVELHDDEDITKARRIGASLVGVNSRDLKTFKIDPLLPLRVKAKLDWGCRVIFESGLRSGYEAAFAAQSGFSAILVGEAVTKTPALIAELNKHFLQATPRRFWPTLAAKDRFPLVKICGITNQEDAAAAEGAGADILGFVLAESPRQITPAAIRAIQTNGALRVGVVTTAPSDTPEEIIALTASGALDALQFHGQLTADEFNASLSASLAGQLGIPCYQALRLKDEAQLSHTRGSLSPRILLDAFSAKAAGGTGERIGEELIKAASGCATGLWLAGGITPENAGDITRRFRPELLDISSGVEARPGKKSEERIKAVMKGIEDARHLFL
jgi:indole-3-glycerol phosphate synthase/phosphoribosylanthranilate isomerase